MPSTCPRDGSDLVELERSGVRIDACRTCRGVWLDRGELEKILDREAQAIEHTEEEDEAFMREMTGGGGGGGQREQRDRKPGFDRQTAERIFEEYKNHKHRGHAHKSGYGKKRKKSFLDDLLG